MAEDRVLVEWGEDDIVIITINRPVALNALTVSMIKELCRVFKSLRLENRAKAIILTGAGRAFCAGVDLTAAETVFKGDVADEDSNLVYQMEQCPMPIIGAINGHAITAGFEISLACDILIASTNAAFADTHCKFGIFPSWGLSQKLPRLIGANRAREASLTAAPIKAETAERWGLISRMVPPDQLMAEARAVATAIAKNHRLMVQHVKAVINDGLNVTLAEGRQIETERAHAYYKRMSPEDFKKMQRYIASRSSKARSKL